MPESSATASRLASDLLRIGAVKLSPEAPFTWASGLRSPVYCDNRLTIGHPEVRRRITDGFVEIIRTAGLQPEVIAGTATAGIPHAAWLADRLGLPMVYVRSKAKGHGTSSRIEGPVDPGRRVLLVEDLVSTGGSSVTALEALREAGFEVRDVLAIYTYGFTRAEEAPAGFPHASWLADRLGLPMVYVRSKAKGHGTSSRIEGPVDPGRRVLLVEDLVSTGGSSVTALEALREAGFEVRDVLAIYTYGFTRAEEAFAAAEARLHVLTSLESLIDEARAQHYLDGDAIESLEAWRSDPEGWSAGSHQL